MTRLIEFRSQEGSMLRGLLDTSTSKRGVIFIHGFERTTIERKFKVLVDYLKEKTNLFRFDFSGCGLSDGDFSTTTVARHVNELAKAVEIFTKETNVSELVLVAHSFGACIALLFTALHPQYVKKLLFIAPAFNQNALQRYWFVKSQSSAEQITWTNYKTRLREDEFISYINQKMRLTKEHEMRSQLFQETQKEDYQKLFTKLEKDIPILVVHGDQDITVPHESNSRLPKDAEVLRVKKGDHDLQRPDMISQYLPRIIRYVSN